MTVPYTDCWFDFILGNWWSNFSPFYRHRRAKLARFLLEVLIFSRTIFFSLDWSLGLLWCKRVASLVAYIMRLPWQKNQPEPLHPQNLLPHLERQNQFEEDNLWFDPLFLKELVEIVVWYFRQISPVSGFTGGSGSASCSSCSLWILAASSASWRAFSSFSLDEAFLFSLFLFFLKDLNWAPIKAATS